MVKSFNWLTRPLQGLKLIIQCIQGCQPLYYSHCTKVNIVFLMVFIGSSYKSTQLVVVQLEHFSQSICFFIRWICVTWIFFADSLLPWQGKLVYLNTFLRQHVPIWEDKLFTIYFLPLIVCQQRKDWQLLLWLSGSIFPFKVMLKKNFFFWSTHLRFKLINAIY